MSIRSESVFLFVFRVVTMLPFTTSNPDTETVDLRTLRAVRVLRPLKLVSGIPSSSHTFTYETIFSSQAYKWCSSRYCVRWHLCYKSDFSFSSRLSYSRSSDSNSIRAPFIRHVIIHAEKSKQCPKSHFRVRISRLRPVPITVNCPIRHVKVNGLDRILALLHSIILHSRWLLYFNVLRWKDGQLLCIM